MNKKVYIIGTVIVVLLIVVALISGQKNTTDENGVDFLATSTVNDLTATTSDKVSTSTLQSASTTRVMMYTMAEVAVHKDATSCWTAIDGSVYDLTKAIDVHPGGREKILSICGKDGSQAFGKQHGGQEKPESALATMKIGELGQ